MRVMKWIIALTLGFLLNLQGFAWNATGHQVVASIAYHHLNKSTKTTVNRYLLSMKRVYQPLGFVQSATWLDIIRYRNINWFDKIHYINIPFSPDNTPLPSIAEVNVRWGVEQALIVLKSRYTNSFDKGLALRILIHILGDLHQPLHTVSRVTHLNPTGDKGGNLYYINALPIAKNLHGYWDNGAGLLQLEKSNRSKQFKQLVASIEQDWPCTSNMGVGGLQDWINESNRIAKTQAYSIPEGDKPSVSYQSEAERIVRQRLAFAGCRLANVLNQIY